VVWKVVELMSARPPTTDQEWAEYLRGNSSDPDDQSLAMRIGIVEYLKAKTEPLKEREEYWLALLQTINAKELKFLRATTRYRLRHERPCAPRWHWPRELEELFRQSLR
jgi:hypothetical protein